MGQKLIWNTEKNQITSQLNQVLFCLFSCFSRVRLFATPWTVARWAPLSMGFPRQEYWSGLLLQGIFLTQGLNLCLLHWQVDSLPLSLLGSPILLKRENEIFKF